jgi:hypothetical protein
LNSNPVDSLNSSPVVALNRSPVVSEIERIGGQRAAA